MDIICDTNIWYDIGFGSVQPKDLKSDGKRLLATPLSLLEMTSKMEEKNFDARRNAAQAVIDHADEILPDPEHHLAQIWQVTPPFETFDWEAGIQALARAQDMNEFSTGVPLPEKQLSMKVDLNYATTWRTGRYDQFATDMEKVVDTVWPGYEAARRSNRAIHMPQKLGEEFDKATSYPEQIKVYVLATYARATQLPDSEPIVPPADEIVEQAVEKLTPYAKVYQKYVVRLATVNVPRANDLGDLECFLYVQDGRKVLTQDQNWIIAIARAAGEEEYLVTLQH